jgi:hypothetical protein
MSMTSEPVTRKQLAEYAHLSGKELTAWIKAEQRCGRVISVMRHVEPSRSQRRAKFYCFIAPQESPPLEELQ